MSVRADWRLHAACRDADPELFFPISTSGPGRRQAEQAKRVCGTCPAQPECLAWALDHGVTDGVWGGTTADQRRAIRGCRRLPVPSPAAGDSGSCQLAGTPEPPTHAPARPPDVRHGSQPPGGFARAFRTADGHRVMVAALSPGQFADLVKTARLATVFAFLERLLHADFSTCGDLYTHRVAIAALLAPWFARCTVAELDAAFGGTSIPWACLHDLSGQPGPRR